VSFSPFNDVDPLGLPDFAVQSFGAGESPVSAGGHLSVTYSVKNIGTATGAEVPFVINLVQPVVEGTPIEVQIGAGSIPSLPPGATITQTNSDAVVPASLAPGTYSIRFVVGSDPIFPDADLTNNTGASPIIVPRPSLIRVCARTITTTPQTVPTLSLAMQYVGEGGTVRICDGVYSVFDVGLNAKSLTIEGEGPGLPTLEVGDHNGVFFMNSPTPISTVVTLRKLRFHGGTSSNVTVAGHYGALLIDQVEFHPPSGAFGNSPSGLGVYLATGNGVTVQNSTFIGGARGVHEFNSTNVVVVNNSFSGQSDWAIIGDTGSVGDFTAIGNTITHVPYGVGIFRTGGPGTYKILNNSISVDLSEQSWTAIAVQHGTAEIRGNTITGVGGNLDPATRSSWPLRDGIWVSDSSSATISNNALSSAYVGFNISNGSNVHGRDNIVTNVSQGLQVFNTNTVAITRSDFSNYTTALITDSASGIAVCNWWGSTEGPQGIAPWYSTAIYAPWSTSPIANEPTVTCGSIP
jgi:hypothetical protein